MASNFHVRTLVAFENLYGSRFRRSGLKNCFFEMLGCEMSTVADLSLDKEVLKAIVRKNGWSLPVENGRGVCLCSSEEDR